MISQRSRYTSENHTETKTRTQLGNCDNDLPLIKVQFSTITEIHIISIILTQLSITKSHIK